MRTPAVIAALLAAAVASLAFGSTSEGRRPAVTVVGSEPLRVVGFHFVAREQVRVTLRTLDVRRTKRVVAGATGRFTVTFAGVPQDRCMLLIVSAIGSRGSRAGLKVPQPLCPPPL